MCLIVSALAFPGGGVLLWAAVHEVYGDGSDACRAAAATCHDPRGSVVIAFSIGGFALFALGAAAWLRAAQLVARARATRKLAC